MGILKKSNVNSHEESLCSYGPQGSWRKEVSREGNNRAKESCLSDSCNAMTLKAKGEID